MSQDWARRGLSLSFLTVLGRQKFYSWRFDKISPTVLQSATEALARRTVAAPMDPRVFHAESPVSSHEIVAFAVPAGPIISITSSPSHLSLFQFKNHSYSVGGMSLACAAHTHMQPCPVLATQHIARRWNPDDARSLVRPRTLCFTPMSLSCALTHRNKFVAAGTLRAGSYPATGRHVSAGVVTQVYHRPAGRPWPPRKRPDCEESRIAAITRAPMTEHSYQWNLLLRPLCRLGSLHKQEISTQQLSVVPFAGCV